ncbi:HAD-IB family hydrolase [Campylobacter sp. FMV-PI01]|uniref:HAD-IB family hydrolase n=1 Tax=Campylobacter portucalensis TaxID=2608384 RepID=A0A6L5WHL1_9BACT|nr:HAD-IB family hydrolase [Campylobacter portucalensis]MSN96718.1 HAD-IB family hydrolase [Campylobacter portucalensis]
MILGVFDLDKTLILGDSYDLWHEFLLERKILGQKFIDENKQMGILYEKGELDMDEYLKFSITSLKSLSVEQINDLIPIFLKDKIEPIIHRKTREWLAKFDRNLIISATPEYIVKPISNLLKANDFIGVELEQKDGFYTPNAKKPLSFREGKVLNLELYLKNNSLNPEKIAFYTDSINDISMCEYADFVTCVNPDMKLRKIAIDKKWDIVDLGY